MQQPLLCSPIYTAKFLLLLWWGRGPMLMLTRGIFLLMGLHHPWAPCSSPRLNTLPPYKEHCISYAPNGKNETTSVFGQGQSWCWISILSQKQYKNPPDRCPRVVGRWASWPKGSFLEKKANTTRQFNLLSTGHVPATLSFSPSESTHSNAGFFKKEILWVSVLLQ